MPDLSEFLLARIADDEAAAERAVIFRTKNGFAWVGMTPAEAAMLAISGHRLLAECEAKRGLLRHLWVVGVGGHDELDHCDRCQTIRYFGEVYADHPDYDESWRPA